MATPAKDGLGLILGLYRSVLRTHRQKLAGPMRDLGDSYAKAEFKGHLKGKTTMQQWQEFVTQWTGYVDMLHGNSGQPASATSHMAEQLDLYLTAEQKLRLEALKKEASKLNHDD